MCNIGTMLSTHGHLKIEGKVPVPFEQGEGQKRSSDGSENPGQKQQLQQLTKQYGDCQCAAQFSC